MTFRVEEPVPALCLVVHLVRAPVCFKPCLVKLERILPRDSLCLAAVGRATREDGSIGVIASLRLDRALNACEPTRLFCLNNQFQSTAVREPHELASPSASPELDDLALARRKQVADGQRTDSSLEDLHVIRDGERFLLLPVMAYNRRTVGKEPYGQNEGHGYPRRASVALVCVIEYQSPHAGILGLLLLPLKCRVGFHWLHPGLAAEALLGRPTTISRRPFCSVVGLADTYGVIQSF
jgi:hypothetical protein